MRIQHQLDLGFRSVAATDNTSTSIWMIYQDNMISTYLVKIYFVKSQMLHEFMFILKKWKKNDFMGLSCDILNCRDSMAWRMNTLVLSLWMCIRLMEVVDDDLTSNLSCLSCNKSTCRHSTMINEWWVPFHVPGYNVTCWGHSSFSFRVSVRTPVSPATLISHMVCWMTVCSSPRSTSILMFQFWVFWISGSWENTCLFSLASLWFTALVDPGLAYVYVCEWQGMTSLFSFWQADSFGCPEDGIFLKFLSI